MKRTSLPLLANVGRREFITLLGGAAAWPFAASAQQAERVHRIGVIVPFPESVITGWFEQLSRLGFAEGRNLAVDRRGIGASYEQFPVVAAELASARVDAIACAGDASIRAAQAATKSIPIVGATDDMVGSGLAASLARPGGNTTGVSLLARELDGKRLELLFELFLEARRMAVLADSQTTGERQLELLRTASRARGVELSIHAVARSEDVAPAVEAAKAAGAQALNVLASPLLHGERQMIIARAASLRLPAIYQWPATVREGGLIGYGPSFSEFYRQWARQLAKVLRGAKPADLPIEQPTRFELAINLATAKAIGVAVPAALLLRADEVIE